MAEGFHRIVAELGKQQSSAIGACNPLWGSAAANHRTMIRQDAGSALHVDLSDLKSIPRPKDWSISISHAKGLGAWIAIKRQALLGFDIELNERIKPEIIERVSTKEEIVAAPNPNFIWCAKEAYYKALEEAQPAAVTQLEIFGWETLGENLFSFEGRKSSPGKGLLVFHAPYIYAVCLISSVPN